MSNRLEEIKKQYAKEIGFNNWNEMAQQYTWGDPEGMKDELDDIAKRYAKECCEASLEKASEKSVLRITRLDKSFRNSKSRIDTNQGLWGTYNETTTVDKESITNPENIIIL